VRGQMQLSNQFALFWHVIATVLYELSVKIDDVEGLRHIWYSQLNAIVYAFVSTLTQEP
jgi:uncharacterized membrane protein YvlD (DUF360 family)